MRLDAIMPNWHMHEVHSVRIVAEPQHIYAALEAVTLGDVPLVGLLFAVRLAPALLSGQRPNFPPADKTILTSLEWFGLSVVERAPPREIVLGTVGQFWRLTGGERPPVGSADSLRTFARPGFAVAAMNFSLHPHPAGGQRLRTETRVRLTDSATRRAFARYWRVVRPGSALIRRLWLDAVRRRATAYRTSVS